MPCDGVDIGFPASNLVEKVNGQLALPSFIDTGSLEIEALGKTCPDRVVGYHCVLSDARDKFPMTVDVLTVIEKVLPADSDIGVIKLVKEIKD